MRTAAAGRLVKTADSGTKTLSGHAAPFTGGTADAAQPGCVREAGTDRPNHSKAVASTTTARWARTGYEHAHAGGGG
ncbi:hypothetical protein ABIE67_009932 [Streptomyces sp. V4I8]|uniref:hypothetical protein n=1 Tax=Streptomyces sp. V4I8 TaxID=3156469 RepID=UPI00351786AC